MKAESLLMSGKIFSIAILLWSTFLVETGQAGETRWTLTRTTPSGRIYHRDPGSMPIPWVKIVTEYEAPPARVHAIVTDYNHFAEFVPNVAESRIVREEGHDQWVYHHLHFRGPVADRVYLIKSTDGASRPEEDYFRIAWDMSDEVFPDTDLSVGIRPEAFSGYWELQPGAHPDSTEAHYAIYSDPGGFIPGWLVVNKTDTYIQQVVEAIRERLVVAPH